MLAKIVPQLLGDLHSSAVFIWLWCYSKLQRYGDLTPLLSCRQRYLILVRSVSARSWHRYWPSSPLLSLDSTSQIPPMLAIALSLSLSSRGCCKPPLDVVLWAKPREARLILVPLLIAVLPDPRRPWDHEVGPPDCRPGIWSLWKRE